ncbi:MAG: alpha-D-ribose 1-methylphosphonate 5-triphosphate diphosphatase [Lachnospiraceae bacterium]|nr:alpha-D-ribose 1-methylphosphonate 5-triphosphate diphosphatase [Lachnospiraceae bacterium]
MSKTLIYNACIIKKDGILDNAAVLIEDKIIKAIYTSPAEVCCDCDEEIDAEGAYLMPGFIDLHSDNIERVAQPRPQSLIDFDIAIREQEKQLVCQGITTMYHSLTIANSEESKASEAKAKMLLRTPENHKKLVQVIRKHNDGDHLIHHRFHCRYDITNTCGYDMLIDFIKNRDMQLMSFVDHTPGQGQYRDLEFFKKHVMTDNQSDAEKDKILFERMSAAKITSQQIEDAAKMAKEAGIPMASHDDDSIEKLDYVMGNLGVNICEFPIELEVAKEAHDRGLMVVVGANNILMGRSHSNNLSALEAIRNNCADILVSDYFPASLLHAVFKIADEGLLPLYQAVNMATYNPACAVGIGETTGSIEEGMIADLLIVGKRDKMPVVHAAFVDGKKVLNLNYREHIKSA